MIFDRHQTTEKGRNLIAKAQAGRTKIQFTKVRAGDGLWSTEEDISKATKLKNEKQSFGFASVSIPDGNQSTVILQAILTNTGLKELYYLTECGLYAEDPDEGEILYAILVANAKSQYLPAENGIGISYIELKINVEVFNASEVTVSDDGVFTPIRNFNELKKLFDRVNAGIIGGTPGQMLMKDDGSDYGFSWHDKNIIVQPFAKFPEEGQSDALYIDGDSSELYIWRVSAAGVGEYFKLPLGSEASATLQKQITANLNAIVALQNRTTQLENKFVQTKLTALASGWMETTEGRTKVYTQDIAVAGVTEKTAGRIWPNLLATTADAAAVEIKAQTTFSGHGKAYTGNGVVTLKCYGKKPAADFGLLMEGK